jgi:hypothetical protein
MGPDRFDLSHAMGGINYLFTNLKHIDLLVNDRMPASVRTLG